MVRRTRFFYFLLVLTSMTMSTMVRKCPKTTHWGGKSHSLTRTRSLRRAQFRPASLAPLRSGESGDVRTRATCVDFRQIQTIVCPSHRPFFPIRREAFRKRWTKAFPSLERRVRTRRCRRRASACDISQLAGSPSSRPGRSKRRNWRTRKRKKRWRKRRVTVPS